MKSSPPILQAVASFGPRNCRRYGILDLRTKNFWNGHCFAANPNEAKLYDRPATVCREMAQILRREYEHLPLNLLRAPVEIEVYGEAQMKEVAVWLSQASHLNLRTHQYGNGPGSSLVVPSIYWSEIQLADSSLFSVERFIEDEDQHE